MTIRPLKMAATSSQMTSPFQFLLIVQAIVCLSSGLRDLDNCVLIKSQQYYSEAIFRAAILRFKLQDGHYKMLQQ